MAFTLKSVPRMISDEIVVRFKASDYLEVGDRPMGGIGSIIAILRREGIPAVLTSAGRGSPTIVSVSSGKLLCYRNDLNDEVVYTWRRPQVFGESPDGYEGI